MSLVNEVFKVYNYVPVYNCNQQYKVLVLHYFLMIYGYYYYSMCFYCTCTFKYVYLPNIVKHLM